MKWNVMFRRPNNTVAKMHGCKDVLFMYDGSIVRVMDANGDCFYVNSNNCLVVEFSETEGEADADS